MNNEIGKKSFFGRISKPKLIGIILAVAIIGISVLLLSLNVPKFDIKSFYFICGIAFLIGGLPFLIGLIAESKREKDVDQMFLEFSRDLVEGVRSGTPISKSIINIRNKDYGALKPNIQKLANQIALGIPVKDALDTFSKDVGSSVIKRAVSLIREAEMFGGRIENILESVTFSISQIEKLKKERKAAIYNLTVQGYIIFLVFILIMLVLQFKILPIISGMNFGESDVYSASIGSGIGGIGNLGITAEQFTNPFLLLLLTQGFFAGLVIGKISEGNIKSGLKHSFILVLISWLSSTGANIFLK